MPARSRLIPAVRLLGLSALLAALLLRGAEGPHAPGAPPPAVAPAYLFLSANTEDLSVDEAVRRLRSPRHEHFKGVAADILRQAGVERFRVVDALGDWSDGVENSLLVEVPAPPELETLRYAAVCFGLQAEQKGVLAFRPGAAGPDLLAELELPGADLAGVRAALDRHGVRYRTIVPLGRGFRVVVYDEGGKLRTNLTALGKRHGVAVRWAAGTGVFVGEESREQARETYREQIRAYEALPQQR